MSLVGLSLLLLLSALTLAAAAALRGGIGRRLVAFQAAGTLSPCLVVLLAATFGEPVFLDVALAMVLLGLIGTLAFARFLERWL